MRKFLTSVLAFFLISLAASVMLGQEKKVIDHSVYDGWKSISRTQLSADGKWISYEVNPQEGDGWLYIVNLETGRRDSIERGVNASFMPNSDVLVFKIRPQAAVTRKAKVDKKKPDEMPKDTLAILILSEFQLEKIPRVKSFSTPKNSSSWFAYLMEKEPVKRAKPAPKDTTEVAEAEKELPEEKKEKETQVKSDGSELIILNPLTGERHSFKHIVEFNISDEGNKIGFIQVEKDSLERSYVRLFSTTNQEHASIFEHTGLAKGFQFDEKGNQSVFLHSSDTSKTKVFSLYYLGPKSTQAAVIVDTLTKGMPEGYHVSDNASLRFSKNGSRILVGTTPRPVPEPKDTLLREERYSVDVWSWHDDLLQPMQKSNSAQLRRRTFSAVYHIAKRNFVQLANEDMPELSISMKGDGNLAIGANPKPYLKQTSWEAGRKRDIYLVDVNTGQARLFREGHDAGVSVSPGGTYLLWWNTEDRNWYAQPTEKGQAMNISAGIPFELFDVLHDSPSEPRPYGTAGWMENDRYLLVYDQFDIWKLDPAGKEKPVNMTGGFGRENNFWLQYRKLDQDTDFVGNKDDMLLTALHLHNKKSGFFTLNASAPGAPRELMVGDYRYWDLQKAKNAPVFVWTRSTFNEFPDLWVSDMAFNGARKLSNANPQKDDYWWGTVELVEWTSFNQEQLQGLLYKPEDFDPAKKYPMLVYFYERSSDGLYSFTNPAPSRSTINRAYSVSNGYLVFIPDIPYREGWPGPSAYDAIVSGTYAMIERYPFVDKDRIGLQGQSWGGYQIAYLITQTNLYRAAMAGAPVSNMISAYGGIRWQTGMSRMFQYEQTQSRIGGTLWEKPFHYIQNSPIFWADRVETPLLMMHNDADGAVPWYQGIEYFVALRRLNKPVWMLVYNDEAHNLRRRPNAKDLSIRMYQFFDHYLKDAPMPAWMEEGITYDQKGLTDGYELVE